MGTLLLVGGDESWSHYTAAQKQVSRRTKHLKASDARFLSYQPEDSAARLGTASEQELQRELNLTLAVRRLGDDSGRCVRPSAREKDRIRIRRPVTSFRCRLRDVLFTHK